MHRSKAFLGEDVNQVIFIRVVDDFYFEGTLYTFLGNQTVVGKISLAWTSLDNCCLQLNFGRRANDAQ